MGVLAALCAPAPTIEWAVRSTARAQRASGENRQGPQRGVRGSAHGWQDNDTKKQGGHTVNRLRLRLGLWLGLWLRQPAARGGFGGHPRTQRHPLSWRNLNAQRERRLLGPSCVAFFRASRRWDPRVQVCCAAAQQRQKQLLSCGTFGR